MTSPSGAHWSHRWGSSSHGKTAAGGAATTALRSTSQRPGRRKPIKSASTNSTMAADSTLSGKLKTSGRELGGDAVTAGSGARAPQHGLQHGPHRTRDALVPFGRRVDTVLLVERAHAGHALEEERYQNGLAFPGDRGEHRAKRARVARS